MCRLSIIVPYDRDEAAFEATLVSVLENRPDHCEVIVAHDGGYGDPFDLSDEVNFVVGDSADPVSLVQKAASASLGSVVHVLARGARATEGWVEEPLAMFEQADLACVAPVVRDLSSGGRVVAAGWRDARGGLRQPLGTGAANVSKRQLAVVEGCYLNASFWRRSTMEALAEIPLGNGRPEHSKDRLEADPTCSDTADYMWSLALRGAGWRCRVAAESNVIAAPQWVRPHGGHFRAAAAMQSARSSVLGQGSGATVASSLWGLARSPLSGAAWAHSVGRLRAAARGERPARQTLAAIKHFGKTAGPGAAEPRILSIAPKAYGEMRRAA